MAPKIILALTLSVLATAASPKTWASVQYIYHGEKTPTITNGQTILTQLGANQLRDAGTFLRSRYITGSGNSTDAVNGASRYASISQNVLDNSQVEVWALDGSYITASAAALMQGLYPPSSTQITLGDGSTLDWPLNGYQYPNIETLDYLSFNYIWLAGNDQCPTYETIRENTQGSDQYLSGLQTSSSFLSSLQSKLPDLPSSVFTYQYATDLWEYALYQYNHNATYHSSLDLSTMMDLYNLASNQSSILNSATPIPSSSKQNWILTLSGQTLASYIVGQFRANIAYGSASLAGSVPPVMSLLFGSYEPMMAFFALSQLNTNPITKSQFSTLPLHGSVMAFELFSNQEANDTEFPKSTDDLYLRFAWRNGTNSSAPMLTYPLFGRGNSEDDMSWLDFVNAMEEVSLSDVSDWCRICESPNLFCAGIKAELESSTTDPAKSSTGSSKHHLSNVAAGVIGAVVTLGIIAIIFAMLFFLGFRWRRQAPAHQDSNPGEEPAGGFGIFNRSSAAPGGFKGAEKRQSDADVADERRGHERVGSWEMKGAAPNGGSLDHEVQRGEGGAESLADYGRRSEDGLAGVDLYGKGVEAEERV